jgi:hypothetical protein
MNLNNSTLCQPGLREACMKGLLCLGLFVALGSVAHATTIYQACTIASDNSPFPATPANLPVSTCAGFQSSPFGPAVAGPGVGDTINHFALLSDYRIFLQSAGPASVGFGHVVNNIGAVSSFNNLVLDPVTSVTDLQWGSGADISSAPGSLVNVFDCAVNAVPCSAIRAAINSNSITITTTYDNVSGPVGEVAAQYIWAIDYTPAAVPEPSTLVLLAAGLFVFAIRRPRSNTSQ